MFDEARLKRLIDAYFDQQLQPGEKGELEAMLLGSSRAREIFLDHSEWHGLTREWALRESSLEMIPEAPAPQMVKASPFRPAWWLGAGIAACLLLAWSSLHFRTVPGGTPMQQVRKEPLRVDVAMLGQAIGVVWEDGTSPIPAGSPLPKGWLHVREGTLRLDFYSGATVIIDGPASFELLSPDLLRVDKGKLTANVPPPAEGFTVLSGNLRVVDRGTEFGMQVVQPGDFDIHVFKGAVELQGDVPAPAARDLRQGDAMAIRGGVATNLQADRSSFTDLAALHQADLLEGNARWKKWKEYSDRFRNIPELLVYFDFENPAPGTTLIPNCANGAPSNSFGTTVGCERLSGRWPEKGAVSFTKTSDRVRFRTSGETSSLTLMAWLRVDSLLLEHSSLLTMSFEEVGELHWKLGKSGRILVGIRAVPDLKFDSWERLESPVVVTERDLGRWIHIATVIDGEAGVMRHFFNGEEIASGPINRPTPVRLGLANLGNFDAPVGQQVKYGSGRSFNGRIDEFSMISRCLTSEEIRIAAR